MRYDFDLYTNNLLLLDTKQNDNEQFYGKAIGKASLSLKGPQNDMKLTITGETSDTSHIFIPTSTSKQSAEADFIVFKQYGTELSPVKEETDTRLSIDLDLTANEKTQIDVILDELTGDIIKATGNGRLQIHVPANGDMTMKGRYNIAKGSYDFNFQSLVKKPFELLADAGNYIEWTGNPYNANIHIDAQYTADNVSMSDLVSNSLISLGSTASAYRGDVFVIAELRGKLTKPDISFRFDFPSNSIIKNDQDLQVFLRRLQSDENEMLKQVTWLIVFGSFFPESNGVTGTGIVKSVGVNTISQKISNEVNKMLSNVLYKLTGDRSLQFDIGTSTYSSSSILYGSSGSGTLDRQTVNLKVNQSLLNGKLIITFGGNLDFGLTNTSAAQSGNFQWLPDISVQIVLTRDRKLRAVVFNKSTLDVSGGNIGRRTRQGVSISYTRDFDKLFGDKKEMKTLPVPPETSKKAGSD